MGSIAISYQQENAAWTGYGMLDFVVSIAILLFSFLVASFFPPYCRSFSWNDPTIDHSFVTNETFPVWSLGIVCALVFLIYVLMVKRGNGQLSFWLRVQYYTLVLQEVIVTLLKLYAGRIRPDYLSRLRMLGYNNDSYAQSHLTNVTEQEYYCGLGDTNLMLYAGRLSFPSGHSSTIFALAIPVCIFLRTRLPYRNRAFSHLLLSMCPLALAFVCAVSRTRDNRHNFDDILAGAAIGTGSALLCYHNFAQAASERDRTERSSETEVTTDRVLLSEC
ncbi:hypothetical protein TRVL_03119 [Trypanosoma vivax]|uniref:Phosphatidic acid phosphatase type 2/haloperoxidase domain-containing protein n=1 Tax=Trypanosoma vivax (strain Y486) TaxID=1055687 RepID=G0U4X6_TRYVY|nr:hypothetical protein TRVL_03119 [Trypanosoma vivax]CCC52491.1 conserved hypothetical protein [Trypanosoma vivax Y486]